MYSRFKNFVLILPAMPPTTELYMMAAPRLSIRIRIGIRIRVYSSVHFPYSLRGSHAFVLFCLLYPFFAPLKIISFWLSDAPLKYFPPLLSSHWHRFSAFPSSLYFPLQPNSLISLFIEHAKCRHYCIGVRYSIWYSISCLKPKWLFHYPVRLLFWLPC